MNSIQKYQIKGVVQGVGFRPFIVKIAAQFNIHGWILNDSNGVTLEIEGSDENIQLFINEIKTNHPPLAAVDSVSLLEKNTSTNKYTNFYIKESVSSTNREALIATDSDVCPDCLRELFTPTDRRYRYPFINCTNCGPRYSIIEDVPYDRKKTTMKHFPMCKECESEYKNISDRRFHAQPVACWKCGPEVELFSNNGNKVDAKDPIEETVSLLRQGKILAIKGIGGYHLVVDPKNEIAVLELRKRKKRNEKPFALLSEFVENVKKYAHISKDEESLLSSKQKPIVLLDKKKPEIFSKYIAPRNNKYGVMLAYTPIQHLILRGNFDALICTSANVTDYPIEYENKGALDRLQNVADYFLIHNRDIKTRVDDSIIRSENDGTVSIIRRSRSYCPNPLTLYQDFPSGLALGAELKNTFCLNRKNKFFISQHIGDLKNLEIYDSFKKNITHLKKILEIKPEFIACDLHPNYWNTRYSKEFKEIPIFQIQHHHAHMASCMAENNIKEKVVGIAFDGVGYGLDGHLWGGEFLVGDFMSFQRSAHFSYTPLLGGDKAVKEPYRIAIAMLLDAYGDAESLSNLEIIRKRKNEFMILSKMYKNKINSPLSCSVGRIFDGVAALLGVREYTEYEGQAAIELEQAISDHNSTGVYPYSISQIDGCEQKIDITPTIKGVVADMQRKVELGVISKKFHDTLILICEDICLEIRKQTALNKIVLSGGVFQNQYLLNKLRSRLKCLSFDVYTHAKIPCNDGGISLGQAIIGAHKFINYQNL